MDSSSLMPVAAGVGLAVLFVGAFWLVFRAKKKLRLAWSTFAQNHGFEQNAGPYPGVKGEKDGRSVEIGSFMARTAGGRRAPQRVVEFQTKVGLLGAVPAGLVAGKRGALQGAGSVQTGDPQFDKKIWVDCPDPGAAQAYLSPERKEALYEVSRLGAVALGPKEGQPAMLFRTQAGYKPRLDWLEARLAEYLAIARKLDGA